MESLSKRLKNFHKNINILRNPYLQVIRGLLVLTFVFLILSIFFLRVAHSQNLIFSYYLSIINIFEKNPLLVIIPIGLVIFNYQDVQKITPVFKRKLKKNAFAYIENPIVSIFLAVNLALVLALIVGFFHINFLSVQINLTPQSAGIITGENMIEALRGMDKPPFIKEISKTQVNKEILSIKINNDRKDSFYLNQIISSIPKEIIMPLNINQKNIILLKNNLLVTELNDKDLEMISPILGNLMVKDYFRPRYIKSYPELRVLGRQEYLKVREDQINHDLSEIDKDINLVNYYVNDAAGRVADDKDKIVANKTALDGTISLRDSDYNYCINSGYWFYGYFFPTYPQSYCESKRSNWNDTIAKFQKNIDDWDGQLGSDQAELNTYITLRTIIKERRDLVESEKEQTPAELGVFHDGNKIDIALDWINSKSLTSYLETLVHEYLHYTSYVSNETVLPVGFEEGLTENYSRNVIKHYLGKETNFGYPLLAKVMSQLVSKMPSSELENVYFTKDQNALDNLIVKEYGEKFNKDYRLAITLLPYLDASKALKLGNEILGKIGGTPLTEKDLLSQPVEKSE